MDEPWMLLLWIGCVVAFVVIAVAGVRRLDEASDCRDAICPPDEPEKL